MKRAIHYAQSVVDGSIPSSNALYDACNRFNKDLERTDIFLDKERIKKILHIIESQFKTSDGHTIKLYPFQVFIIVNIYGWFYTESKRRRTTEALLFMPRGVGKSFMAAIIGLIDMMYPNKLDKNPAMCVLAASTKAQAGEVFQQARDICKASNKVIRDNFSAPDSKYKHVGVIAFKPKTSTMQTISSESKSSEGANPSCFVLDEYHVFKDDKLLSSLQYAGAKRENPLGVVISTAGHEVGGVLNQMYDKYKEQLSEETIEDNVFALIYDLDAEDIKDWKNCIDNGSLYKVNPLYGQKGQSKVTRFYNKSFKDLEVSPTKTPDFKTKLLNIFVDDQRKWVSGSVIRKRMSEVNLEKYRGWACWIGIDLAKVNDLSSVTFFLTDGNEFVFHNRAYLPENTAKTNWDNNIQLAHYIRNGNVHLAGNFSTDYNPMINYINKLVEKYELDVYSILYDNWNAEYIVNQLQDKYNLVEHKQSPMYFNSSVQFMETLINDPESGLVIDYNPIVAKCFDDCILKSDRQGNCKPDKSYQDKKIDCAISSLQALGGYLYDFKNGSIGGGGVYVAT